MVVASEKAGKSEVACVVVAVGAITPGNPRLRVGAGALAVVVRAGKAGFAALWPKRPPPNPGCVVAGAPNGASPGAVVIAAAPCPKRFVLGAGAPNPIVPGCVVVVAPNPGKATELNSFLKVREIKPGLAAVFPKRPVVGTWLGAG